MILELTPHPHFPYQAVSRIEVEVRRCRGATLDLRYRVSGCISDLLIPEERAAARGRSLWEHTCLEAFVRTSGDHYFEFNFSPSSEWAAYCFDGHRSGMHELEPISAPIISTSVTSADLILRTSIDLSAVHGLPDDQDWKLGLSAIIEEEDGQKSYWALAHPPGKADFHHIDCFAQLLPGTTE